DRRGLRRDGACEGTAGPARYDPVRGAECDPAAAQRLCAAVRQRSRRPRLRRVRLQLPRRRPDAAAGGARHRLPARAGAPRGAVRLRDRREPDHGRAQPRPRPAPSVRLMSQLDPTLDLPLAAPPRSSRAKLRVPGWAMLLVGNPKSRTGLLMIAFVLVIAVIAPYISASDPNGFNMLATRQAPSWHHLFGTTDQGSDIFSQVVVGARR